MKVCLECKNEFEPSRPKMVYCSNKCRQKSYRGVMSELAKIGKEVAAGKLPPSIPVNFIDKKKPDAVRETGNGKSKQSPAKETEQPNEAKTEQKFNFGDMVYLDVEKVSKFPTKNAPSDFIERVEYFSKKKQETSEIKKAWIEHQKAEGNKKK